ncbi:toll/interleukin-1 receptor domain-containing protein [Maricaulis sp.]|uniref:toll/interleukin-1 receptor domain-containing protein n=1 Tax=Maricaulis sp. TaxID=1486257 RepID=UPI003A916C69
MQAFISYSHSDEQDVDRLRTHLSMLERDGLLSGWHDRKILAGSRLGSAISSSLNQSELFLAMISADFLASGYCFDVEMKAALKRQDDGLMRIVPIILQPCEWKASPLGHLLATPTDGVPVSDWTNRESAFLSITQAIRKIVEAPKKQSRGNAASRSNSNNFIAQQIGSRRYRIKRTFDPIDKRDFAQKSFDHIRAYFISAVEEINSIEGIRARIDEKSNDRFSVHLVNSLIKRGEGYILIRRHDAGHFGDIDYSTSAHSGDNSSNGGFRVNHDEFELFLSPQMFAFGGREHDRVTGKQAAEMLWSQLLEQAGVSNA